MHDIDLLAEAQRQFAICNACRYCEGYCAVFPAMERRTEFAEGDINYLAHLCHDCRGCYQACMYSDPHEFAINIPQLLSSARVRSYERYAWPATFAGAFDRPATAFFVATLVAFAIMGISLILRSDLGALTRMDVAPGSFYRAVPYAGMLSGALALALWALLAWARAIARFVAEMLAAGRAPANATIGAALWDGFVLTYMRGGGNGCYYPDDRAPSGRRRAMHIVLVGGVLLAFVATCAAAIEQEFLNQLPPYPWFSVPVITGTLGGIAIVVGASGLLALKSEITRALESPRARALDITFLIALDSIGLSGLILLLARGSAAMTFLLVVHLALVAAVFATAPYGKLVHAWYRIVALAVFHREERSL